MLIIGIVAGCAYFVTLLLMWARLPSWCKNLAHAHPLLFDIVATVGVFMVMNSISSSMTGFIASVTADLLVNFALWMTSKHDT
mgnify:FL=1